MTLIALTVTMLATAFFAGTSPAGPMKIDFDTFEVGKPAPGFSYGVTGGGGEGSWLVREDLTAPSGSKVLVQTSADKTSFRFLLCVYDALLTHNALLSVRFKALSGEVDQAAGLIVRFRDKDNYYVVRANALEDNVRLYKVIDGKREQLAGAEVKVAANVWHTLRLSLSRYDFEVWLDGQRLFAAKDMALEAAGEVGLWTKADSVTAFDDFTIEDSDAGR